MKIFKYPHLYYLLCLILCCEVTFGQTPPLPDGRRLREIVADKYPEGNLLIGGTTGEWSFGRATGIIMDREYSYVTPENDFKQSYVHPDNSTWNWARPDAWISHILSNNQVLRMHGPVSPQSSTWAKSDNRTAEELETNMRAYMRELCKRYNGKSNFLYMDVVNEVVQNGQWKKNEAGTGWEMPWFIIGQDNDKNKTPLFIKYAFQIANEYAPDVSLVINQHEGEIREGTWNLIKETVQYLRDSNLRVDGIGWQAHVDVGWEKIDGQQDALRNLIDWAHNNDLDFHITECNVFLQSSGPESFKAQAETYKAIVDIAVEKSANGLVTWNTWNIDDESAWQSERFPTMFDNTYNAKPAYYAVQLALEAKGDYSTKHRVQLNLRNTGSGEAIPDCSVIFNNDTSVTNENGSAFFEVTAGIYDGSAEKRHYNSRSFNSFSVYSDTIFTVSLDSAEIFYNVTFQVEDTVTGTMMSAVNITLGEQNKSTELNGKTTFTVNPGIYTVNFNKLNYTSHQADLGIQSDTTFTIKLKRSHADVKFRLKNGTTPVNNVLVVFNGDSLYTNSLGFCVFRSLVVGTEYNFIAEHDYFKTYEGSVELESDTTLNLQLQKTVANVEFLLLSDGIPIESPFVAMNNDTAWFDENLKAKLFNIPIDTLYRFQIKSINYPDYTDTVLLKADTSINVTLIYTSLEDLSDRTFSIYPNPAKNNLHIVSEGLIAYIEIIDHSGKIIKKVKLNSDKTNIDISGIHNGFYLLRGFNVNKRNSVVKKLIIQH